MGKGAYVRGAYEAMLPLSPCALVSPEVPEKHNYTFRGLESKVFMETVPLFFRVYTPQQ